MKYLQKIVYKDNILPLLVFLVPVTLVFSSPASSTLMCFVFAFLICSLKIRNIEIQIPTLSSLKLELLLLFWMLISLFWTTKIFINAFVLLKVAAVFIVFILLMYNTKSFHQYLSKSRKAFFAGVLISIALFIIEYKFDGLLHKPYYNEQYRLALLNEYCTILSIMSWLVIGFLVSRKKHAIAIIFFAIVFWILMVSDSLSSFVGFGIAGIIFVFIRLSTKFLKLFSIALIIGSLSMPIVFYQINPQAVSDKLTFLPLTAKVRLFLWHFAADKSTDKIILGHGFNSSRNYTKAFEIRYYDYTERAVHFHNNILQMLFELGIVGFTFFIAFIYKITKKLERITLKDINFGSAYYACFINYYIIGMIYFSNWRGFWLISFVFVASMLKWMLEKSD